MTTHTVTYKADVNDLVINNLRVVFINEKCTIEIQSKGWGKKKVLTVTKGLNIERLRPHPSNVTLNMVGIG